MQTRFLLGSCLLILVSAVAAYGQRDAGSPTGVASPTDKSEPADSTGTYDNPITLAVRQDVKVVYQIKTDSWKKGVAAGLHYLDKLARAYDRMGVKASDRRIVGVFHGDAGYFLVKGPAYRKASDRPGENPNKAIVQKLLDAGVKLELCKSTMQSHGWTGEDVLPGVRIVAAAYARIIDLQLRGHAYIRF